MLYWLAWAIQALDRPPSSVKRSLTWSHFCIPYAYGSHSVTPKCHSIQRQANTLNNHLSRFLARHIWNPPYFPRKVPVSSTSKRCLSYIFILVLARSPPQPPREDAERGTALRHWDAVSRQSGIAVRPTTQNTRQSRKHIVYSLFRALTEIQTAVTELQMMKRVGSNCGCRHIVAAILLPGACGYPA